MIVLDTHVIFWLAYEPEKLSKAAISAIGEHRKTGARSAISSISLYEIARIVERGRFQLDTPVDIFLGSMEAQLEIRQITSAIAKAAARLPNSFPGDPSDRLIAATAIVEGAPLITADRNIRRSGVVKTIW